jgi:acyl carrier protein
LSAEGGAVREAGVHTGSSKELVLRAENTSEAAIRDWCVEYLARTLDLPDHTVDPEMTFARLGLDSANSVFLIVELEDWLGLELTPDLLFEHPTIGELARHLVTRAGR